MRRLLFLLALALVVLAAVYRERIYVRDPLGRVQRGGAESEGARVFINFSNDVLVQENDGRRMFVVQGWNRLPGVPTGLTCVQGMLCVTPSDQAIPGAATPGREAQMSAREVSFTDEAGTPVVVRLR